MVTWYGGKPSSGARARALYPHLDRALVARKILQAIARLDR
jgi:hypothetical protein